MAQDKAILRKLKNREIKIRDLEKHVSDKEAADLRLRYFSEVTGLDLKTFSGYKFEPKKLKNKNIENLTGSIEIPLGVSGPLLVNGQYAQGKFYIPMATTEGTLIASVARGSKIINMSGGATVSLTYPGMTRAPLLRVSGIRAAEQVETWVKHNFDALKVEAAQTSAFLELTDIRSYKLGRNLWLRMSFDTSEAMGMNMATKAAKVVSDLIVQQNKGARLLSISGNLCNDKKPSIINMLLGRGRSVHAEVTMKREDVIKVLKTTPEEMVEVNQAKVWQGGVISGSASFNAHFANIIAAVFAATGQDLAHIVNSSQGYMVMELEGDDLYAALSLPSLLVGNIGGGTGLPDQATAQKLMLTNIDDPRKESINNTHKLAEILAVAVLAGDINLHAALGSRNLVKAHQKLGRGRKQI
ncbi:MAG: hydroxymethylglutaryl-CoA reductase [Candidatus Dojkabacteria bacterium]